MKKELFMDLGLEEEIAMKCVKLFKEQLKAQEKSVKKDESKVDDSIYKEEIEKLEKKLTEQSENHLRELHSIKIETALDKALNNANVINPKAVKPFLENLNIAKFTNDGTIEGLSDQLKTLMENEETSFLFKTRDVKENNVLKGVKPGESLEVSDSKVDFSKMSYSEIVAYTAENPETNIL